PAPAPVRVVSEPVRVITEPIPEVVAPIVPPVQVRAPVRHPIPELSEPARPPRNPGHIPELDVPKVVLPEEPIEVGCRACGRG
ncbi:MAG: hypothetical protein ABMA64_37630, partial [Myxococcota bacterium]